MFIREYDHHAPSPCYVMASKAHWQRKMKGGFPHSPGDMLAILDASNPLRFRQLKYGIGSQEADRLLQNALKGAHFLERNAGKQTGLDEPNRRVMTEMFALLNGVDGTSYCNYYIGGVVCRCRSSRNELTILVGSTANKDFYRTIRISEVEYELHLRFQRELFGRHKVEAMDFHLSNNPSTERMDIRIREHRKIRKDPNADPWIILDGHAVENPGTISDCRDIQLTKSRADGANWVMPVQEYFSIPFENPYVL